MVSGGLARRATRSWITYNLFTMLNLSPAHYLSYPPRNVYISVSFPAATAPLFVRHTLYSAIVLIGFICRFVPHHEALYCGSLLSSRSLPTSGVFVPSRSRTRVYLSHLRRSSTEGCLISEGEARPYRVFLKFQARQAF